VIEDPAICENDAQAIRARIMIAVARMEDADEIQAGD